MQTLTRWGLVLAEVIAVLVLAVWPADATTKTEPALMIFEKGVTLNSTLTVTGATTFSGSLNLCSTCNLTVNTNKFTVAASSGNTVVAGTFNAAGATTLDGAVTLGNAAADAVTVTGTFASNLIFTDATYDIGASGATRPRDFFLSRNATVGGTFNAVGATTLDGAVTLGNAAADAVTVTGTLASNLIFTDATYDIGASGATRPRDFFLSRNATLGGTLGVTGATTLSSTLGVASGVSTLSGGVVHGATINTGTGATLTTATSGQLHVAAASADNTTVYILPAASTKASYCFSIGDITGAVRELLIETPAGSDLVVGTTTAAGGTGIATTAGASHGIKNTRATGIRGNGVCVYADGTNTWYMQGIAGTWAAY